MNLGKATSLILLLIVIPSCGGPARNQNHNESGAPLMLLSGSGIEISRVAYPIALLENAFNLNDMEFQDSLIRYDDLESILSLKSFFVEKGKYDSLDAVIDSVHVSFEEDTLVIGKMIMLIFQSSILNYDFSVSNKTIVGDIYLADGKYHLIGQTFKLESAGLKFETKPTVFNDSANSKPGMELTKITNYGGFDWPAIRKFSENRNLKNIDPVHSYVIGQTNNLVLNGNVLIKNAVYYSSFIDTTYYDKYNTTAAAFFTIKAVENDEINIKQAPLILNFDENMKLLSADKRMIDLLN